MFSRIPNLRILELCSQNFSSFVLKQGRIFVLRYKNVAKTVCFLIEIHSAAPLKENKTFSVKKIRGFVDSKFVKTCQEHIIYIFLKK